MTWDPQACPPPGEGGGGRGEGVPSAPDCVDQGMLTCASGGSIPTFVRGVLILSPGLQSPPSLHFYTAPVWGCGPSFGWCSLRGPLAVVDALHLFSDPRAFLFSAALSYPGPFSHPLVLF